MLIQAEKLLPVFEFGWKEQPVLAGALLRMDLEADGFTVQVISSEFMEYDSSNPTHACAYYRVTLDVHDDQVEALKTLLDLE